MLLAVDEILAAAPPVREAEDAVPLPRLREAVRFEHVDFSYGGAGLQLSDVCLEIRRGQRVGLVANPTAVTRDLVHAADTGETVASWA